MYHKKSSILERIEMERIEFKMKEGAGYTKYSYDQVTPRGAEIAEFSLLVSSYVVLSVYSLVI